MDVENVAPTRIQIPESTDRTVAIPTMLSQSKFVSDKMSYTVIRGCWYDTVLICMHHLRKKVMTQRRISMRN
jgi:hypothetical protein